jgi:hypothetical protein
MKKSILIAAAMAALAITAGSVTVLATQGDKDDPLVTLSYLQKVVTPELEKKVDEAVKANSEELAKQLDIAITSYETRVDEKLAQAGAVFQSKELKSGERFTTDAGREVLLVSGSAAAVGTLADTTAGGTVSDGERLAVGHLYVTASADAGIKATEDVAMMVR